MNTADGETLNCLGFRRGDKKLRSRVATFNKLASYIVIESIKSSKLKAES